MSVVSGAGGSRVIPGWDPPHMYDDVDCARCHDINGQPGGHIGLVEGQTNICFSCHTTAGQALAKPFRWMDIADPFGTNPEALDGRGRSHAWGVPAVNTDADSVGPTPGGVMEDYLDVEGKLKCATCHNQHNNDVGAPFLRVPNTGDAMCKECHAPRNEGPGERGTHPVGFDYPGGEGEFPDDGDVVPLFLKDGNVECMTCHAPHYADSGGANDGAGDGMLLRAANDETLCQTCHVNHAIHGVRGDWQPTCTDCHDPHDPESENLTLIGRVVNGTAMTFEDNDLGDNGLHDFIHSNHDPAGYDGMCEVCHTSTAHHRNSAEGDHDHNATLLCTDCHLHDNGFMPVGGDCTSCHASVQDNGDGVPAGGRRAVVGEFPIADAHAHYGTELNSDACTVCHDMATHMDGNVDLLDADTGALYTFIRPEDLASDPDVSTFCQSCHDEDGAQRLDTPADPFGGGNTPSDVATKLMGTLQWAEWYGDFCFGEEGTLRQTNSHHDINDADQAFSGAKLECLNCHGAHTASQTQKLIDPDAWISPTPWGDTSNMFCLVCHDGGAGPTDPGFSPDVLGPAIAMRGIDSCDYNMTPWWMDYSWTNAAHGMDSKRSWPGYSGAPEYNDMDCMSCHDPHGSYTATNTLGNPYMIRDFVDGTMFVDDGVRPGGGWTGPPWDTMGVAREVVVTISGIAVDWGSSTSLCSACHASWLSAYDWHSYCDGCQTCHNHGQSWGGSDWGGGEDDSTHCPPGRGAGDEPWPSPTPKGDEGKPWPKYPHRGQGGD